MGKGFQKAAIIFLVLGAGMLLFGGHPFELWVRAATSMTNIIAIVAVMQTFAVPIKIGGYGEAIKSWMDGRLKGKSSLFIFLTLTTHLLTSFLTGFGARDGEPLRAHLEGPCSRLETFFRPGEHPGLCALRPVVPGAVNLSLVVQATGLSGPRSSSPAFSWPFWAWGPPGLRNSSFA